MALHPSERSPAPSCPPPEQQMNVTIRSTPPLLPRGTHRDGACADCEVGGAGQVKAECIGGHACVEEGQ